MSEKELDVRDAKQALNILREYCINCCNCDNCDKEIKEWCDRILPVAESPCEWNSFKI